MTFKKKGPVVLFRLTLGVSLLLSGLLVLLTFVAIQAGSDLKLVVQFFSTTKDSATLREFKQLNTLSPIEFGDRRLVNEMLVRYYLEMRYEQIPDVREMKYRWGIAGPVYTLSSLHVYNEFAEGLEKKLEDLPDVIITIYIKQVVMKGNNTFDVDFSVLEHLPNGQIRSKEKNVVAEFRYDRKRRRFSHYFSNPYGLVFVRFEEKTITK